MLKNWKKCLSNFLSEYIKVRNINELKVSTIEPTCDFFIYMGGPVVGNGETFDKLQIFYLDWQEKMGRWITIHAVQWMCKKPKLC